MQSQWVGASEQGVERIVHLDKRFIEYPGYAEQFGSPGTSMTLNDPWAFGTGFDGIAKTVTSDYNTAKDRVFTEANEIKLNSYENRV